MVSSKLTVAVSLALAATSALAQTPLYQKKFDYKNLPYQADTDDGERGRQYGYNRCNSTTENQQSRCQTALINALDDFCLWGGPEPDSIVGNTEGESVAWCTKPGRGTRLIPAGALTGVQFIRTPDYVQVTGLIKQEFIDIKADDSGGEMDPHGADQRGNPLGGLVFSNAFKSNGGKKDNFQQVSEWHNFMGGSAFCFKACDPAGPNAAKYCQHIYDRIGCKYNAPAAYAENVFESCDGESQDFPGIYTDAAGAVQTYHQPPEALGEIQTMPYEPRIPATSNCVQFQSTSIYAALPTPTNAVPSSSAALPSSVAPSNSGSSSGSPAASTSKTSGSSTSQPTSSATGNAASALRVPILGVSSAGFWSTVVFALGGVVVGAVAL